MGKAIAWFLSAGLSAALLVTGSEAQALTLAEGQLCVGRAEDTGFVNIVPVTVEADASYKIKVSGGDHRCIPVVPGRYKIRLSWSWDPRDPHPHHVKTVPISKVIKPGETRTLHVCVSRTAKSYPTWQLDPPNHCRSPG